MDMEQEDILFAYIKDGKHSWNALKRATGLSNQELQGYLTKLLKAERIIYDKDYDAYYELKLAKLSVKEAGYAFAIMDNEEDYFISSDHLNYAYNGDSALVYAYERGSKKMNAKVVKIVERAHHTVIGILRAKKTKNGISFYIESTMRNFPVKVLVRKDHIHQAVEGNVVEADITYKDNKIFGEVTQILGFQDDPGIEISQIAAEYGFKTAFPEDVMILAKQLSQTVEEKQLQGRRDFTNYSVITIDGDDSKDFDDAVYVERANNGNYILHVYIADVAEYVKADSKLDEEALKRGTSVYLADRVIPMLPRELSNGICSLNEGVIRLVLACLMEIDGKGNLVNYEICEGYIRSLHRMTYRKVNAILRGDRNLQKKYADIEKMIFTMQELSHIIRQRRYKKGGLEFEVDEYKFELNSDGSPKSVTLRTRDDAEKIIEDFMLQANETIAYHMNIMQLPCVYRVHEKPDQDKLHSVFELISNMGVHFKNTRNDIHSKQIQTALDSMKDNPYSAIIHNLLLRSMMKAKYSEKCMGHFGLAMQYYCHFTSPIRRYPDLMVHRLIKSLLLYPKKLDSQIAHFEEILPDICLKNSLSEKNSVECEREVNDMLYAWYMSYFKNQVFSGMITSITSFGMYVSIDNGAEGLVSFKNMDGYFELDSEAFIVTNGIRKYRLGDKVEVVVLNADKESRQIDFMLKEDYNNWYGDER